MKQKIFIISYFCVLYIFQIQSKYKFDHNKNKNRALNNLYILSYFAYNKYLHLNY